MSDDDQTASLMSPAKLAQLAQQKPQASASPGAWLDKMAADVGKLQLIHLRDACVALRGQAGLRDLAPLVARLQQLESVLGELDFALLQPQGWWARKTGKSREAGEAFAAQVERLTAAGRELVPDLTALHKAHLTNAQAPERTLVEVEVEHRALGQMVEQGEKWLRDMKVSLQQRQAAGPDDAARQQMREDTLRSDILAQRLAALRAIAAAAQALHQQVQGLMVQRAGITQQLAQALPAALKGWQTRLATVAQAAAADSEVAAEGPREIHEELVQQVRAACTRFAELQALESALASAVSALAQQIEATARA